MPSDRDHFTPPQLARLRGISTTKILGWIRRGELSAVNMATDANGKRPRWKIPRQAIEDFDARRQELKETP